MTHPTPSSSDQCALDSLGNLKDTSEILFYESESDQVPLPPIGLRRGQRTKNTERMLQSIAMEQQTDQNGNVRRPRQSRSTTKPTTKKAKAHIPPHESSDPDDEDFVMGGNGETSGSVSSSSDEDCLPVTSDITNNEIADILPSKTFPGGRKRKRNISGTTTMNASKKAPSLEEIEDEDSPRKQSERTRHAVQHVIEDCNDCENVPSKGGKAAKRNPIYHFYEQVTNNADGNPGKPGDKHYKCYHGGRKVLTVTLAMKSSLNGLIGNLKTCSPSMHQFYLALKDRPPTVLISEEELQIASGQKVLNPGEASRFLRVLESKAENVRMAFNRQVERGAGPWDQGKFERLLTEWIVACDQPFDEVDKPEFRALLTYVRHPSPNITIPGRNAIKRRVTKLGEECIETTRTMLRGIDSMFSISLDAWTSPNLIACQAMIIHFVTDTGDLDEMLLDFRELVGEHSGENMAEAVWETMTMFGIEGRVLAFMMDNATNNDTFIDGIKRRCDKVGIQFNPLWARLRCMPHTIHLAAIKLLEGIGAITKSDRKKCEARNGNYQQPTTTPILPFFDNEAAIYDEGDYNDNGEPLKGTHTSKDILSGVEKLRKIIRAVRSSPQRKQDWLQQVRTSLAKNNPGTNEHALMLILDVKTRWSSTHQMMDRALQFRQEIDIFVDRYRELRPLEISSSEWDAIASVSDWLLAFRSATTQMSATKEPMLSSTHAIFRGLQEHIRGILRDLPDSAGRIKAGLIGAHEKLSDYYYRYDETPYYTWAALLDPRINYEGMSEDYADDPILFEYLQKAKADLQIFYTTKYANISLISKQALGGLMDLASTDQDSSKTVNFTARYEKKQQSINELDEYLKLRREDYKSCRPLKWWVGRRAQFPNLWCLVRDIFSIPGSAVAVERIFSGGRDTISLRRASLNSDTIRTLMVTKHQLRLARNKTNHDLGYL